MLIQPTDVEHTAAYYANTTAKRGVTEILIAPYLGYDGITPFIEKGIAVKAIGCIAGIVGSHNDCHKAQTAIRRWKGVTALRCADMPSIVDQHNKACADAQAIQDPGDVSIMRK